MKIDRPVPPKPVRQTVRASEAVRQPVGPAQAVGEAVGPTQAVREPVRSSESVRQSVRPAAETVCAAPQPVRPPGLRRPAPPEEEAIRQAPFRRRRFDGLCRSGGRPLLRRFRRRRRRLVDGLCTALLFAELLLDHLLNRRVAEIVELVLEGSSRGELHATVGAGGRVDRDGGLAHRARDGRIDHLRRLGLAFEGADATQSRQIRLAELRVQFRLEHPKAGVRRVDLREPIERLQAALRVVERRLGGGHREQGVRVPRIQLEALGRDLQDETEALGPFVLGFEDPPAADGPWLSRLRRIRYDPHAGLGHLQDAEGRVGRGVFEMEDADLPDDSIAAPAPLDLDDAVERLMKGRELRVRVHLLFEEDEARELVAIELPLRALRERIDLGDFVGAGRGRQELDHGTSRSVSGQGRDRAAQRDAQIRQVDRGPNDDPALLDVVDRFLAPRVPVHDSQPILVRDRNEVHAEALKLGNDRVGRLRGGNHESAASRPEAFREEREREAKFFLARGPLEDDARADRQAALDHRVESGDPGGEPRRGIIPPTDESGRSATRGPDAHRSRPGGRPGRLLSPSSRRALGRTRSRDPDGPPRRVPSDGPGPPRSHRASARRRLCGAPDGSS